MTELKLGISKEGKPMHYTVGALIERYGKYLVINRALPPLGWAGIAGHLNEGEDHDLAIVRKVRDEVGLEVITKKLLSSEEISWNICREGVESHYWYLYDCKATGQVKLNPKAAKSYDWLLKGEISKLQLEKVWDYWFKKFEIIEY